MFEYNNQHTNKLLKQPWHKSWQQQAKKTKENEKNIKNKKNKHIWTIDTRMPKSHSHNTITNTWIHVQHNIHTSRTTLALHHNTTKQKTHVSITGRKTVKTKKEIHYIKQDRYGNLFNPQGMYSERNQSQSTRFSKTWDFRVVTPKAFDLYLKFLETKNEAWLSNAERELA